LWALRRIFSLWNTTVCAFNPRLGNGHAERSGQPAVPVATGAHDRAPGAPACMDVITG
jgi:hypothetical protein